ncbi:MAG: glycoside hydrolase family 3 protein, partial [Planctomycetes bacterium]|nr:glycoside hydrolase family 3 protein [Planctomycetota bacterium]
MTDRDAVEKRVQDILGRMTLEEKADMLVGHEMWHFKGVARLGVPMIRVSDCGHGVTSTGTQDPCATCFPTAVGQGATWNVELIERMGAALGSEVRCKGNAMLLGPMVNIHRMPLNGRSFECYSEDPLLTGKLAAALVRGIQSQKVGACVKGCTANNQQADQE